MKNEGELVNFEKNQVDIWLVSLSRVTDSIRTICQCLLTRPELERMQCFASQSARDQYLVARALLRFKLFKYTKVPPCSWSFDRNEYGRPFIVGPKGYQKIQFNISHSDGLVVCAFSVGRDIGIDIENTTNNVDFHSLSSSFFTDREKQVVGSDEEEREAFFSYWTLKESYIKGRGIGLSMPLDSFWFDLSRDRPRLVCTDQCNDDPERWQFFQFSPTEKYVIALAAGGVVNDALKIRLKWVDPGSFSSG